MTARRPHPPGAVPPSECVEAIVAVGEFLRSRDYRFVSTTPATHARALTKPTPAPPSLPDIVGWNRSFTQGDCDPVLFDLLHGAGLLRACGARWRSRIRFSTLGPLLLAHSGYPTEETDAVFFGPDTYRFAAFLQRALERSAMPAGCLRVLDLGCGTGAGGLLAAACAGRAVDLALADVNPRALRYADANARLADRPAEIVCSDLMDQLDGRFDLIVMNPPYLCDDGERLYRHGGGDIGMALPVRMVEHAFDRLRPGGLLVAYTGTPVVDGHDRFRHGIAHVLSQAASVVYEEIDPDVFGEELARPAYRTVDRIAAVGVSLRRPDAAR